MYDASSGKRRLKHSGSRRKVFGLGIRRALEKTCLLSAYRESSVVTAPEHTQRLSSFEVAQPLTSTVQQDTMAEKQNDNKVATSTETGPSSTKPVEQKKKLPQLGALEDDDEFEVSPRLYCGIRPS